MTNERIMEVINTIKKGTMFRISYKSELPVKALYKNMGYKVIKVVSETVRTGIDYDNIGVVIERKSNQVENDRPARANNYEWVIKNSVLYNSNTDKYYVRVVPLIKNGANKKVKYEVVTPEGTSELEKLSEEIKERIQNSYFSDKVAPAVKNIGFNNIITLK